MTTEFEFEAAWKPFASWLSTEQLMSALNLPLALSREAAIGIVPSFVFNPDSVQLRSLFLVTESFLCEVSLDGNQFDYVARRSVSNMRWSLGAVALSTREGTVLERLKSLELVLEHGAGSHTSVITYIGNDSSSWLAIVGRCLPTSLLIGARANIITEDRHGD